MSPISTPLPIALDEPSPRVPALQAPRDCPRVHKWHKRGNGGFATAGEVARAIRVVRSQPLDVYYQRTLCGDWPGGTGREILFQFSRYCTDEINRRGGLSVVELSEARLIAKMRAHIKCECAWCGQPAPFHRERNRRFCGDDCRASYFH